MNRRYSLAIILIIVLPVFVSSTSPNRTLKTVHLNSPVGTNTISTSPSISDIYGSIRESNIVSMVKNLSDSGPRPWPSKQNENAKNWILSKLDSVAGGKIETEIIGSRESVLGRLPGNFENDSPSIMVGGHFDSVSLSPGANDNGIAVAATLEIARVLSQYSWPLDIYFGFWNDEENGLNGAREVASELKRREVDIIMNYNIDMLLVEDSNAPADERVMILYNSGGGTNYHTAQYWAEIVRAMNNNYGNLMVKPVPSTSYTTWGYSDHFAFLSQGYSGVTFSHESGFDRDTAYHTSNDVWDNSLYNYTLAEETTASIAASIAFAMGRSEGEVSSEKYTEAIPYRGSKTHLSAMTMETNLTCHITSEDGGSSVEIKDPSGERVGFWISSETDEIHYTIEVNDKGLHEIIVENRGPSQGVFDIELVYQSDIEGNGIPDSNEPWHDSFTSDSDGDGIIDADEIEMGLDISNPDSDNDSLSDFDELYVYYTDPLMSDSDEDNMPDAWELKYNFDPNIRNGNKDPDYDTLLNQDEYAHGCHPLRRDTDNDTIIDGWEVYFGLDPTVDDADEDPDGDGMTNVDEIRSGYDPFTYDGVAAMNDSLLLSGTIALVLIVVLFGVRKSRSD